MNFLKTSMGVALLSVGMIAFGSQAQFVCPFDFNDGGPYVISEGDDLQLNGFVEPGDIVTPVREVPVQVDWSLLDCLLGPGENISIPWGGPGGVQECLIGADGDGINTPRPNALSYNFGDGFCFGNGQTDFHVQNTAPGGQWQTSCGLPLNGIVNLQYEGFDPSQSDFPLGVEIILHTPDVSVSLESTTLDAPGPKQFAFDSSAFANGPGYSFELILSDDEDSTNVMLNGCEIANEDDGGEEDRIEALLAEAQETLDELDDQAGSIDGLWTQEMLDKLLAMKKQLEDAAAAIQSQLDQASSARDALDAEIAGLTTMINDLKEDLKDKKDACDDLQDELDDLTDKCDDVEEQMEQKEGRVHKLQNALAAQSENLSVHEGDAPLDDIAAGAAVSFDGGKTWLVMAGEQGVKDFLSSSDKLKSVRDELRDLEKQLRDLRKQKADLEKETEKKQNELDKCNDEKDQIEDEILDKELALAGKNAERDALTDQMKDLKTDAEALNAKIDEFNALAKECGLEAKKLLLKVEEKLRNAPPDVQDEANEEFEERATDEEKDARDDPSSDVANGGGAAGSAAEKLDNALQAASNCPPPNEKTYGPYVDKVKTFTLRGVEQIYVSNSRGTRGLTSERQAKILADISKTIKQISDADTALAVVDFLTSGNPVSLIYGLGFQNAAIDAILGKLSERQEDGVMNGLPLWIEYTFGRLWRVDVTVTYSHSDVYECVDNVWKFKERVDSASYSKGACNYSDGSTRRFRPTDAELDLSGCTLGGCPNAWADAFDIGFKKLTDTILRNRVIGLCEE